GGANGPAGAARPAERRISAISEIAAAPSRRGRRRASNASGKSMKWISAQFIHAARKLNLLPPPLAGEGWGGGELAQIFACAPSLSLPRKRGRGRCGTDRRNLKTKLGCALLLLALAPVG